MVFGIAGGTCSGKSTLARALAAALPSSPTVVSLDAFYTKDMVRGPTITLSDGTTMFNFNHPDAIDAPAVVATLQATEGDVIVEGLFTLALPAIRERLDSAWFVHLDADLRALRRMLRDMKGGRASTDPEFIARYYIECARVGHVEFVEPSRQFAQRTIVGDAQGIDQAVADAVELFLKA